MSHGKCWGSRNKGSDQSTCFNFPTCWSTPAGYEPNAGLWHHSNPSPPPERDGIQIRSGSTPPLENAHSGAGGFEPMAAGRAFEGAGQRESLQDSGEAPQMSTTMDGGVGVQP